MLFEAFDEAAGLLEPFFARTGLTFSLDFLSSTCSWVARSFMEALGIAAGLSSLTLVDWTLGEGDLVMLRPGNLPSLETLLESF